MTRRYINPRLPYNTDDDAFYWLENVKTTAFAECTYSSQL